MRVNGNEPQPENIIPVYGGIPINVLRTLDEIEQLVENGKLGFMGKRVVNEEEFFILIQRLRSELPRAMKDAEELMKKAEAVDLETRSAWPTARDIITQTRDLTP